MKKVLLIIMCLFTCICIFACSNNEGADDYTWDNYDTNNDNELSGQEFQDAVGDFMDEMGY